MFQKVLIASRSGSTRRVRVQARTPVRVSGWRAPSIDESRLPAIAEH
jgi:hypothetical protein